MAPKNRNRRIGILLGFALLAVAGMGLLLSALSQNTQFFYDPSEIVDAAFVSESETIRVGGVVVPGSLERTGDLSVRFDVIDFPKDGDVPAALEIMTTETPKISVEYTGTLPDLFKEGKGAVAIGTLTKRDHLAAKEILAKHDENYQPVKD